MYYQQQPPTTAIPSSANVPFNFKLSAKYLALQIESKFIPFSLHFWAGDLAKKLEQQ